MSFLGNLAFLHPWILAGLLLLPAIWLLLRVTPPAPQRIIFPPARFLADLYPEEQTPSHTPWWILLLRLMTAALIIIALAQPLLNPGEILPGSGPVRIVLDNGWNAAQNWHRQKLKAEDLISRAGREKREIHILTTAPDPGRDKPFSSVPLTAGQAEAVLGGLAPLPWPADYKSAGALLRQAGDDGMTSFFLSAGLQDKEIGGFIRLLQKQGPAGAFLPAAHELPVLLRPSRKTGPGLYVLIDYPKDIRPGTPVNVQALAADGRMLDAQSLTIDKTDTPLAVAFDLPEGLRQQLSQIRLAGIQGAGATLLLDEQYTRRTVGIVTPAAGEESAPFVEAGFYLTRAIEPFADVHTGAVRDLLSRNPAVLIMPDIGALPPDELNGLEDWIKRGGLLLRFAGPNMTQGESFLTPVPLRKGGRALDGAMTWDEPVKLAPFPETSPYYGLEMPEEGVTVKRQMLPEPVAGIEKMTWASLEDGTPLITAAPLGQGTLVMIHTTATPHWSDLALSGLYVQLLRRTVSLAGSTISAAPADGALQPLLVLDGFGRLAQPGGSVRPIPAGETGKVMPTSVTPPGIYGRAGYQKAFNLGDRLPRLEALNTLPAGVRKSGYGSSQERDLMPWLLLAAFTLFLLDWMIMIGLQAGVIYNLRVPRSAPLALFVTGLLVLPSAAHAETAADMVNYAGNLHLAYISSGDQQVDYTTRAGLQNLADMLSLRTSVEPAGVIAVEPGKDELAFFPLIYWPVAQQRQTLSPAALHSLQNYLDHGGTILIDTRDRPSAPKGGSGGHNAEILKTMLAGLNVPPLIPMPDDHVLTKSFYLLRDTPGRYEGGIVWVEENSASGRDGVSSVIIGSHDWAAAWAGSSGSSRGGSGFRQQEMAMRFGVNLVMYALTGNYKADQVHLPHILERLGQ